MDGMGFALVGLLVFLVGMIAGLAIGAVVLRDDDDDWMTPIYKGDL